jgi:hypothetical protein
MMCYFAFKNVPFSLDETDPALKVSAAFGIITSMNGLYPGADAGLEKVIFAVTDDPTSADEGRIIEEVGKVAVHTRRAART